jgi:ribosomal protein L1
MPGSYLGNADDARFLAIGQIRCHDLNFMTTVEVMHPVMNDFRLPPSSAIGRFPALPEKAKSLRVTAISSRLLKHHCRAVGVSVMAQEDIKSVRKKGLQLSKNHRMVHAM